MGDDQHNGDELTPQATVLPSISDQKPDEEGGAAARAGFNYQDEIAVSFLLDMLMDPSIVEIHCETHDDIVIVQLDGNSDGDERIAEYVQVKAGQPDSLWSVANLCQRRNKKESTSIFEKSLSKDKYRERSCFRIVTLRPVVSDLAPLTLPRGDVDRVVTCEAMSALKNGIDARCPGAVSGKSNGALFWLDNCHWDVRHDERSIRNSNLLRIMNLSKAQDAPLLIDTASILLDELRAMAKEAGAAKWSPDRERKIFLRTALESWWVRRVRELTQADAAVSGGRLREKLEAISLPTDSLGLAVDLRRRYSEELRASRYLDLDDCERLLDRVKSEAATLRSDFLSGAIDVDGMAFHALCIKRMDVINQSRPAGVHDQSAFLKGCLYDIADRCLLRFERPEQ